MKVVIQRVSEASVCVDKSCVGSIKHGYLLLVGFQEMDTDETIEKLVKKIVQLRIFEDEEGKMNKSIEDVNGEILSVSQFTLYADCKKGNRPSFTKAAPGEQASNMYQFFNEQLRNRMGHIETGIFGADMKVSLVNDGPVSIILDSEEM